MDAKDINKDDFSTNAEYLEALRIRGEQYKAENAVIENIEAEVEAEVNFIYGTDYDLGDIVTVEKAKWNKVLNLRITELCEVYEYGGMYVVPTFGDALKPNEYLGGRERRITWKIWTRKKLKKSLSGVTRKGIANMRFWI